jgi:hypothetical protein
VYIDHLKGVQLNSNKPRFSRSFMETTFLCLATFMVTLPRLDNVGNVMSMVRNNMDNHFEGYG